MTLDTQSVMMAVTACERHVRHCTEQGYCHGMAAEHDKLRDELERLVDREIAAFVRRINERAEVDILRTGKLEGAHHRAMKAELKAMEAVR